MVAEGGAVAAEEQVADVVERGGLDGDDRVAPVEDLVDCLAGQDLGRVVADYGVGACCGSRATHDELDPGVGEA